MSVSIEKYKLSLNYPQYSFLSGALLNFTISVKCCCYVGLVPADVKNQISQCRSVSWVTSCQHLQPQSVLEMIMLGSSGPLVG